ncbi:MAG: hypothetical protein ACOC91_01800 [bacterium]
MGTTVEQRRRISRYAILVLFMFLVAGSLSTENHWPVFAAITGAADTPASGGEVASAAFELRDVAPGSQRDTSQQLRDIAHNALSASGIGGGSGPASVDRPPEVAPLEFAAAAANPPEAPPDISVTETGRPDDIAPAGGSCGTGRGGGFVPPGCVVREVAWTLKDLSKEERIETAKSLKTVAGEAVAANGDARPAHLDHTGVTGAPDRPDVASRPEVPGRPDIPERPDIAERPTLPERPDIPDRPAGGKPGG